MFFLTLYCDYARDNYFHSSFLVSESTDPFWVMETLVHSLALELVTVTSSLLASVAEKLVVRTAPESTCDIFGSCFDTDPALEQERYWLVCSMHREVVRPCWCYCLCYFPPVLFVARVANSRENPCLSGQVFSARKILFSWKLQLFHPKMKG